MLTEITLYTITHIRVRSNSKGSGGIFLFILLALVIAAIGYLDVYKRQTISNASYTDSIFMRYFETTEPRRQFVQHFILIEETLANSPSTVSYTHLDVYKRQSKF